MIKKNNAGRDNYVKLISGKYHLYTKSENQKYCLHIRFMQLFYK